LDQLPIQEALEATTVTASSRESSSNEGSTLNGIEPGANTTWELTFDGYDEEHQRVQNALFCLAGGGLGTSGVVETGAKRSGCASNPRR
jgi:hypothetical protein